MKKSLILVMGLILNVSCGELSFEETKESVPVQQDFKIDVISKGEPNDYQVAVTWDESLAKSTELQKRKKDSQHWTTLNVPVDQFTYTDKDVLPSEAYVYRLIRLSSEGFDVVGEAQAQIPQDFVLNELWLQAQDVKEPLVVRGERVFLGPSPFVTEGRDLIVEARQLIADDSEIVTFPIGAQAQPNLKGRDGGTIEITVQKAMGSLNIVLRGERGGEVTERPDPLGEQGRGSPGKPGSPAVFQARQDCLGPTGRTGCTITYTCVTRPGNGENGGQGKMGRPGFKGMRGGSTGEAHIVVAESSEFNLSIEKFVGEGSPGGPGGYGGPGGHPGSPGRNAPDRVASNSITLACEPPAGPGAPGPQGPDGPRGENGENGIIQRSCLKLSKEQAQECER